MTSSRTAVYAIIGALVAIVLSFLPFSTLLGGTVSGFLEGPDGREGVIVGGLSGAIMFLPIVAIGFVFLGLFGFGFGVGGLPIGGFLALLIFFGFAATTVFLYTVGLGALGGYLGAYFARDYPEHRHKTRETIGFAPSGRPDRTRPDRQRSTRRSDPRVADATPDTERDSSEPDRFDTDSENRGDR